MERRRAVSLSGGSPATTPALTYGALVLATYDVSQTSIVALTDGPTAFTAG